MNSLRKRKKLNVERLLHVFGIRKVTFDGLHNRCTISLAMAGADIQTVMDHVGWKTSSMARHYIKSNQVFRWGDAGDFLSTMPADITDNYRRQNELLGFSQAF